MGYNKSNSIISKKKRKKEERKKLALEVKKMEPFCHIVHEDGDGKSIWREKKNGNPS